MQPNDQQQPTNQAPVNELVPDQDDIEWGQAATDFAAEHGIDPNGPVREKKDDEQAKQDEGNENGKTPETNPNDKKSDEEPGTGDDSKKETPNDEPADNSAVRDARALQREIEADREAIIKDIRETMFEGEDTELTDADGDPIRTIEDVQKHLNPKTGKAFTDEEAAAWLMGAQNHFNSQREAREKEVEAVAEVNLDLRDQADAVKAKWKTLLDARDKEEPGFSKKLWQEYAKTFTVDPKTNLITKAPMSMEVFYSTALGGYAKAAELAAKQAEIEQQQQQQQQDQKRNQTRSDRSDIYGGGNNAAKDPEEEEWGKAAEAVYGPLK